MLYVVKTPNTKGGWTWQIGEVALASSYVTGTSEPGLFSFSISGVHRQGAELFSTHARAEALLQKHLGCDVAFGEQVVAQSIVIARQDRWIKLRSDDPPEREQDDYSYYIGNVLLASLSNIKSIRLNGYHLYLPLAAKASTTKVQSIAEGEQALAQALGCAVTIQRRMVRYAVGPNHLPCAADGFACRPTLYDGSPAW
jgi:hypothetical protein